MTKADFIQEIAKTLEISKMEAKSVLEAMLDSMVRALGKGDRIEIRGFGSFSTHVRKPRKGRNPVNGNRVDVPARRVPRFKASGDLKNLVNSSQR